MTKENILVIAVKGVILNSGKILLVQRAANEKVGAGTWECPGGKIDFGEDLEEALVREVREEVGLEITVEKIIYASTFNNEKKRQVVILTYLCKSMEKSISLSEEHVNFIWATKNDLRRKLPQNILEDFEKNGVFSITELL